MREVYTRAYGYSILSIIVVAPILGGLFSAGPIGWGHLLLSAFAALVASIVPWMLYFRAVKRLLAHRQAVDARINYGESFATSASAMATPRLAIYLGLSVLMLSGAVWAWQTAGNSGVELFGVVFFAAVTLTFVAMLFTKLTRRA